MESVHSTTSTIFPQIEKTSNINKYIKPEDTFSGNSLFLTSVSSTRLNNNLRFSREKLIANKQKLNFFRNLRLNWNHYEGEPIKESVIERVEKIISDLEYQPQIFPTGRGTIQIEKYIDEDNFVEIEIFEDEIFAYQMRDGDEMEREITMDEIDTLISELYV